MYFVPVGESKAISQYISAGRPKREHLVKQEKS